VPRVPKTPILPVPLVAPQAPSRIFAGTSGWAYPTWKPAFYPEKLPAKKFLEFYASQLTSVEVNYTFRALPIAKLAEGWAAATPPNFRFSFKAPQRITHFKRLQNCDSDLAQFIDALEPLRQSGQLGLLLFQLPPNFAADPTLLAAFLSTLPPSKALQIAFEFRHTSWFTEETYNILRLHNASLCIAESDDLTTPEVHTAATHTSFRLRRTSGYTPAEIHAFAQRFTALAQQRDVYIYFKHDDEPTGALNATAFLAEAVRVQAVRVAGQS
jgi:uncharacterized protein YecE (DUF72 family)